MLKVTEHSVFKAREIDAYLVNPVNTVGIMGKGLALEFKKRYKSYYEEYKELCAQNKIKIGHVYIDEERKIISFPTKKHWRNKSDVNEIKAGLADLKKQAKKLGIESIYMPKIGSGYGGLNFEKDVLPLIKYEFQDSIIKVVIAYNTIEETKPQIKMAF